MELSLQPFCTPMTSRDLSFISPSMTNGTHSSRSQHGKSEWVAFLGHSNQVQHPGNIHHALTKVEAGCLGWIFRVAEKGNATSTRKYGLQSKSRNAVHFMRHNGHTSGRIAMGRGTKDPRNSGTDRTHLVLRPDYLDVAQLYLTQNGIILSYDNIPPEYLVEREQLPTVSMNVFNPGRGHILPSEVTPGIIQKSFTYMELRIEKGDSFVPGGDVPDYVRKTAWEFVNQTTPYWYGKTFFTTPLMTEEAYRRMIEMSGKGREEAKKSSASASTPQPKARPRECPSQEENQNASAGHSTKEVTPPEVKGSSAQEEVPGSSAQEEVPMETEDPNADQGDVEEEVEVEPEYVSRTKSSRYVADNPWILYEAGVVIAKMQMEKSSSMTMRRRLSNCWISKSFSGINKWLSSGRTSTSRNGNS